MILPSSLLVSLFLLTTSTLADDGQYHPDEYSGGSGATTTADAASEITVTAQAFGSASAPTAVISATATATDKATGIVSPKATTKAATGTAAASTGGDWQMQVTWPVGCESWANPCPPGAHISGGGIAGGASATSSGEYTNGFTSYLTETDSNGVITGMPTKVTVAAGVETASAAPTTLTTATSNKTVNLSSPSSTQDGFSAGTSSALSSSSGTGRTMVAGGSTVMAVAGFIVLFC